MKYQYSKKDILYLSLPENRESERHYLPPHEIEITPLCTYHAYLPIYIYGQETSHGCNSIVIDIS